MIEPLSIDERIRREALIPRPLHHHSITDWDFENVDWTLDGVIYHDAAPSITGVSTGGNMLVKNATSGALSNGRLITWIRCGNAAILGVLYFRNQIADGSVNAENAYQLMIEDDRIVFTNFLAGTPTVVDTHTMTWTWSINTWYKIRLTWWTSATKLYLRVERWTGTAWVTLGGNADVDFEDANDRWKDAAVNRCGFNYFPNFWFDDVEVWG